MLPEEVLGQALLYLVPAVGRRVVFEDPRRFGAALYDEAWALLASPFGRKLLIEGVRDGRKHNGAIWLASQLATDFEMSELLDLLGARFVFDQSHTAIPSALRFLGVRGSGDAEACLERGLGEGQCLYRDVRDRVGLVQVLPPALDDLRTAFDTTPRTRGAAPSGRRGASHRSRAQPLPEDSAPAPSDRPDRVTDSRGTRRGAPPTRVTPVVQRSAAAEASTRARRRRRSPLAQALAERTDP